MSSRRASPKIDGSANELRLALEATVQGFRAYKGRMIGLHLFDAGITFVGLDDKHMITVQNELKKMLDRANADLYNLPRWNPVDVQVENINYRIAIKAKAGAVQGALSVATPTVTAMVNGKLSRVQPIYIDDFKKWTAYGDSQWSVS